MTIAIERCRWVAAILPMVVTVGLGGLVGCSSDLPSPPGTDRFLVESVRLSHQVTFASDTAELGAAAPYELSAFLDEVDPDRRAEIYLDAKGPLKDGRLDAVADILDELGRQPSGSGGGEATNFSVTVTVTDDVLLPESCLSSDQWPDPRLPPASCTNALTLVRMVEDPDDLLRGREMGPASGAIAAQKATQHYQRNAPGTEEVPASAEGGEQQQLPPPVLTQPASY